MEAKILLLKKLNAAYQAALEFDYCPNSKKAKACKEIFNANISDKNLKDALDENQGMRSDEIADEMSQLIKNL